MSSVFFYEPFYDFDRFLDDYRGPPMYSGGQLQRRGAESGEGAVRALKPRMDLHENMQNNLVTATFELPGIRKEDVHIDVQNNRLTVSAESKISEEHEERGYAVRERRFGRFSRTLQLPQGIKDQDIKASMEHGVLGITFPKVGAEQAPKKVTIN